MKKIKDATKQHFKNSKQLLKSKYHAANTTTQRMIIMLSLLLGLFGLIFAFKAIMGYMMMKMMAAQVPTVTVSAMKTKYELWQPKIKATASLRAIRGVDVTT